MAWDGKDRRSSSNEFKFELLRRLDIIDLENKSLNQKMDQMASRIEHANNNTKAFKELLGNEIEDLGVSIQGDESKGIIGIASKIQALIKEFGEHIVQDRMFDGIIITILIATLGWTVLHK